MGSDNCMKCKNPIVEKDNTVVCDCCAAFIHEKCSDVSATEYRAIIIQKRCLFDFCPTCRDSFKQIPKLISGLNEALRANELLRNENIGLRAELNNVNKNYGVESNANLIISEIGERQSRACNVIVRNIRESGRKSRQERASDDTEAVKRLLSGIDAELLIKRTFRLGKYEVDKTRPIKVVLSNAEQVMSVIRGRDAIKVPGVIVHRDDTKMQREFYLSVKKRLEESIAAGEDKVIKYLNGVPALVNRPKQKKN